MSETSKFTSAIFKEKSQQIIFNYKKIDWSYAKLQLIDRIH